MVKKNYRRLPKKNGEGGIRTRGKDKPYTAFPRLLLKPLGHLSGTIFYLILTIYYLANCPDIIYSYSIVREYNIKINRFQT